MISSITKYFKLKMFLSQVINMAGNEGDKVSHRKRVPFWGLILIIIGVLALLVNLKIIPSLNWDIVWPILLILLGIFALYEHYQK
jgi:hypothetical protein